MSKPTARTKNRRKKRREKRERGRQRSDEAIEDDVLIDRLLERLAGVEDVAPGDVAQAAVAAEEVLDALVVRDIAGQGA